MSIRPVELGPVRAWQPREWGALVLVLVFIFQAACATGAPRSGLRVGSRYGPLAPPPSGGGTSPIAAAAAVVVDGEGGLVRTRLLTDFGAVRLSASEFQQAMSGLVLELPLPVASAPSSSPLYASRGLVLVSTQPPGEEWRSEMENSYGRYCVRCCTPGDCLGLFKDGSRFDARDKAELALALAVGPAIEARNAELHGMFSTAQLWTTVSITLVGYLALLAAPEPVSKGVAAGFALLAWAYLGWELFYVVRGYIQLQEDAARATTFAELREVGDRFGKVIGPNSVRILVMLTAAAVGSTSQLLSRAPKLPGFAQAVSGAQSRGVRLLTAAEHADEVQVAVAEGSFRVVLPANALGMTAKGSLAGASQTKDKVEVHHIATSENSKSSLRGGPWTPRFKKLFDRAGLSMHDEANTLPIQGHKGPHPQAYHEKVYQRLEDALGTCSSKLQCREALIQELRKLAQEIRTQNSELNRLLTGGTGL